jgi:hypothetical protein
MHEQVAMAPRTLVGAQRVDENPTVEENIDRKISYLQGEIARLEQSKADLAPLLKMRIRDIRQAMDY